MGKRIALMFLGIIFIAGCTTPTFYRKSVTVEKDGAGKTVKTTVVEEVQQPDLKKKALEPKYLDE